MISWSIHREDILLARALKDVPHSEGFYIDVGANNPIEDSVTKLFYDQGWHGLNVEPSRFWYARLVTERPRDININAAVSDKPGLAKLYDHPDGGLGTMVEQFADRHRDELKIPLQTVEVEAVTLAELCERHAPSTIHFLKVDVEGFEEQVIRGMDFTRFRPWILCVEATEPMRLDAMTHSAWDPLLIRADYKFVQFDGQNRWYVANEHPERMAAFQYRFDDYTHWTFLRRIEELENQLRATEIELLKKNADSALLQRAREVLGVNLFQSVPHNLAPEQFMSRATIEKRGASWALPLADDPVCMVFGPYVKLPEGMHEVTFELSSIGLGEQMLRHPIVLDVAKDATQQISVSLEGSEGAKKLRDGRIGLRFRNDSADSIFEFRVYVEGRAFNGDLIFNGVSLS